MTTFTRFLPSSIGTPILRKAALTGAGLAFTAGAIAGPLTLATEAHAAPAHTGNSTVVHTQDGNDNHGNGNDRGGDNGNRGTGDGRGGSKPGDTRDDGRGRDNHSGGGKELNVNYEAQPNFYYCGPAATRNALSADGHAISVDDLAKEMGTTEAGTNSAEDITRALNKILGAEKYHTTALTSPDVKPEQAAQLQQDVKATIDDNRALVANVAGTATDTDGITHSYEGGHYIAVHGYRGDGNQVKIADSANPNVASYWMNTTDLANWMATRGYSH
ncbi:C39 family peptidase [Plantactinospora siamensis]|uniref:C39 family peptidase n=1 Tax=Plantactinospora siamensis TaxID=555372 RepID=A0ABV6NZD3_9ACTN